MGWKLNALAFLFALWALSLGVLIVGIPILLIIFYRSWSNRQGSPRGVGRSHRVAYLGVFLLFLSVVAVAERGTRSPVVLGMAGIALLALGLFPGPFQEFAENVVGPALEPFRRMPREKGGEPRTAPAVELTSLPLDYLDQKKNDPAQTLDRFRRLAQTLAEMGTPVELRLEFSEGSGRILFALHGRDAGKQLPGLLRLAKSQLPEFGAEVAERPAADDGFSVPIEGVPEPSADPVGPLARFFVENRLGGSYCVRMIPAWLDPVSRWLAGRRQRGFAKDSGYQRADEERTTTVVDHQKRVELEESVKGLERLLARRPVRVSVLVSADDGQTALHAATVLAGAMSSQRRISGLRVGHPRASVRSGWRRSTLMQPSEAAPYLWIPQVSLGMKVSPSVEFQAPPATEGDIVLGEVVGLSGKNGRQVRVECDQLAKHIFITGMTGSGKTTSCFGLLLQLAGAGIPFLVIEPVKSEYRSLLKAIPNLQVFTVGDEATAPFRLNIFEPPRGVKAQAHLENLVAVWNASFVTYSPVQYVIPRIFAEAYRACDWDLASDKRGRPVAMDDVAEQVKRVVRGLGYEPKTTMDIEAAINVRLNGLATGSKGKLFGTTASTPTEVIVGRPTVVELKDVWNDEEKAFVAALILANVAELVQARGQSSHLRHFTLVEEAHRLLPRISTEKGDPEAADPRRRTVEQFGNMLAELRAYGEGLAVVEQIPTKILPDAIKNTATKVVHRVATLDDRQVIAGAVNASEEQAAALTALRPGEAVLSLEGHPVPVRVEVEDVVARLGLAKEGATDAAVRERMGEYFVSYPIRKDEWKPVEERMRDLVDTETFREGFLNAYRTWYKKGEVRMLTAFMLLAARNFAWDQKGTVDAATKLLSMAAAFYLPFDAGQREKFPRLFRKELETAMNVG